MDDQRMNVANKGSTFCLCFVGLLLGKTGARERRTDLIDTGFCPLSDWLQIDYRP